VRLVRKSDSKTSHDWALFPPTIGPTLNVDALAQLLYRDRATILADRCRAPERVPPAHKPLGTKEPLWLLDEVLAWVRAHPDSRADTKPAARRSPGRPRKVDQVQRARASRFVAATEIETDR
jgi:hypothetical protein